LIKINLNQTRVSGGEEEAIRTREDAPTGNNRDVLVKAFVIALGTLALIIYEKQNIDQLNSQRGALTAQLNQIREQSEKKNAELKELKDIEPQAQALNDKLNILKEYSKLRLQQLQCLDFVQSIIPERVWLRSVKYENRRYQILGNAVETVDLTDFVQKLEGSAYFQDVIVLQDREKPMQQGKIREFELSARSDAPK
jgi:Tfp pilus assembly protein PilN